MRLKALFAVLATSLCVSGTGFAAQFGVVQQPATQLVQQQKFDLQDSINRAKAGQVITVPAGVYAGPILMKEGVTILGAGPGKTILRGDGQQPVVRGAKNSIIVGFTVEGGSVGIQARGTYMGIFQNVIRANTQSGISVEGGSALIANNIIQNNGGLGGVAVNSGNPYLLNNTLVENANQGVWAWYQPGPTLVNNVITNSPMAVMVGAGAKARTSNNLLNANQPIEGGNLSASDVVGVVEFADVANADYRLVGGPTGYAEPLLNPNGNLGVAFDSKPSIDSYRQLMQQVLGDVVLEHPAVTYDLSDKMGVFYVTTRHPFANFAVRSSTKDTIIEDIHAFDVKTQWLLNADLQYQQEYPLVFVQNDGFKDKGRDRYVLENVYTHPGSYFQSENGDLTFTRETSFSRIEILVPAGYSAVEVNADAKVERTAEGREKVVITEMGGTTFKVRMSPTDSLLGGQQALKLVK